MGLVQVDIDMAHAVYSMNKDVIMRRFLAKIKFLHLEKTVSIDAASMVEATNKLFVDLVRVVKTQKGDVSPDGVADFLVLVDVAGDLVSVSAKSRNIYESIYNITSSVLEVVSVEEVDATPSA
jgi:hypothetical protein